MTSSVSLSEVHVRQCLSTTLENHNEYEFEIVGKPQLGEGYICSIHYATLTHRENPDDKIHIVIKCLKRNMYKKECPLVSLFRREVKIYTQVYTAFKEFSEDKASNVAIDFLPKCLGYSLDEGNEIIVLENLKEKGYDIYPDEPVSYEHTVLVLKNLAKWHAFSYAMKDQVPEVYANFSELQVNQYEALCKSTNLYQILRSPFSRSVTQLEGIIDPKIFKVYKDLEMEFDQLLLCRNEDDAEQYSVICHLDCWTNNFLFKQEGEKVMDVRIIDWQCSSFALPVFDITHFLYVTSGEEQFEKMKDLLLLYHKCLSGFIKNLGSDPEKLYPLEKFNEHWRKHSAHGLLLMPCVLSCRLAGDAFIDELNLRAGKSIDYQNIFIENLPTDEEEFKRQLLKYINYYIESDI